MISRLHYITQDLAQKTHWQQAEDACKGGVDWVQLRVKNADEVTWRSIALRTQDVCIKYGAKLIINDNAGLASEIMADGVHLGKSDLNAAKARQMLGESFIIGGTANTFEDIVGLAQADVDYIGLGPLRFTNTKQNLSPIVGLEGYKEISEKMKTAGIVIPVIGIGGVLPEDVAPMLKAGLYGAAVSSYINLADDPAAAANEFMLKLFY